MRQRVNTPKCVWLAKGVIALMLLIRGNDVYADLIVSNIAGTDGLNYGGIGMWAQSFTTDAQLYRLDDIKLKVYATSSASGIEVAIWSNDAGASTPDTILGSFDIPSLPSSDFDITAFLPSTEVLLYPSTTYWITTTHSSVYDFQFKGTADTFTSPGVMGRGLLHSEDGGLS